MEIAVFPIPEFVALPGQSHKLHVFEPRYRDMMQDCFDQERMVGLALPVKTISESPPEAKTDSGYTNLDVYKAADVMGAGMPKLLQTLDDGRLLVRIDISYRVRVEDITQYLPYYKAEVSVLPDLCGDPDKAEQLVDELLDLSSLILTKEISIGGPVAGVIQHRIKAVVLWVCSWFELEPQDRQTVLELPSAVAQAQFLVDRLAEFVRMHGLIMPPEPSRPPVRRRGNIIEVDFQAY